MRRSRSWSEQPVWLRGASIGLCLVVGAWGMVAGLADLGPAVERRAQVADLEASPRTITEPGEVAYVETRGEGRTPGRWHWPVIRFASGEERRSAVPARDADDFVAGDPVQVVRAPDNPQWYIVNPRTGATTLDQLRDGGLTSAVVRAVLFGALLGLVLWFAVTRGWRSR